jgi:hypothetical protein
VLRYRPPAYLSAMALRYRPFGLFERDDVALSASGLFERDALTGKRGPALSNRRK